MHAGGAGGAFRTAVLAGHHLDVSVGGVSERGLWGSPIQASQRGATMPAGA